MTWAQSSDRKFDNMIHTTPDNVGPGLYDITPVIGNKKPLKAPFGARSNREIFPQSKEDVPPPGSYDAKLFDNEIKISSVFHSNSKRGYFSVSQTPDPTRYSLQKEWGKTAPAPKRYKRPNPTAKPMTVFFGQKGVNGFKTNKNGEWVPIKQREKGPEFLGPGTYDPEGPFDTKIPFQINTHGNRSDLFSRSQSMPGPGEYSPTFANKRKLLPVIAKTLPKHVVQEDVPEFVPPEPWIKDTDNLQPTAAFRSKNVRETFVVNSDTPGPASYYRTAQLPQEYFDNSCFGVRAERKIMDVKNDNPGPGQYNIKEPRDTTVGIKIHSLVSEPPTLKTDVPGPGAYNDNRAIQRPPPRAISVFTSKVPRETDPRTDVPGPGRYNPIIDDHSRAVPISIKENSGGGVAWVNKTQMENPDPTAYQHIINEPKKGLTISRLERTSNAATDVPGPGQYNVVHDSLLHKSFNSGVPDLTKV